MDSRSFRCDGIIWQLRNQSVICVPSFSVCSWTNRFSDKSQRKIAPKIPTQRRRQKAPASLTLPNKDHDRAPSSECQRITGVDSSSASRSADDAPGQSGHNVPANDAITSNVDSATAENDEAITADSRDGVEIASQPTSVPISAFSSHQVICTGQGSAQDNHEADSLVSQPASYIFSSQLVGGPSAHAQRRTGDPVLDNEPDQQLNNGIIQNAQSPCSPPNQNSEIAAQIQHLEEHDSVPQGENDAGADNASVVEQAAGTAKKRSTNKRQSKSGQKNVNDIPRKRRRREERSKTPEGAEDREIAPATVRMQDLCKDQRIGRKSRLEQSMRQIDWTEVVRKRKEAARIDITTQGQRENVVNERLDRAARERESAHHSGPQLRIVNGQMVVDQASLIVDRRAEASRNDDALEEVEEDDLTARVNSHSWLYDNRRDPTERGRPLKSDRWTSDQTEAFYGALRMFGTDFYIISRMFPGKTRRQIKLKFVREEKSNPAAVKAALVGETVPMDFNTYLAATGQEEDSFKDPKELEAELQAEDDKHKEEIEKRKEEHAELMRQRKAAGAATDGEGGESSKENKKGKSKKGNKTTTKRKQSRPRGGEEVEILGDA